MIDRKIDVEKLSDDQVDNATDVISKKIGSIVDKAVEDSNKILSRYNLKCKMQIVFEKDKSV